MKTFHLIQYEWEGNLFDKEGVSKSAVFNSGSDTVISCSLGGRRMYLHPSSGLAFGRSGETYNGLGKSVENVIEGVSWGGPQYINGESVESFIQSLESMEEFDLTEKDVVESKEDCLVPPSEDESYYPVLMGADLSRNRNVQIEICNGKIRTTTGVYCVNLLPLISKSLGY